MALWDSTSINNQRLAKVFNHVWTQKAIPMVVKKNGLVKALLGGQEANHTSGLPKFERSDIITGNKHEITLLGKLPTIGFVANGSAEVGTYSLSYANDYLGAATFDLAHANYKHPITSSELNQIRGNDLKGMKFMSTVQDMLMAAFEKALGQGVNSNTAPADNAIGGWQYAIDTSNSYGGINRAAAGNEDYRGVVVASGGTLTADNLQEALVGAKVNGGDPSIGVCSQTVYRRVNSLIEPYQTVEYDAEWGRMGSRFVEYAGVKFLLDSYAPSGVLGLLDPTSWLFIMNDVAPTQGIIYHPSLEAGYILPVEAFVQFICKAPGHNAKITGIV